MSFKCRFLARDKATAKSLVERYADLPPGGTTVLVAAAAVLVAELLSAPAHLINRRAR